MDHSQVQEPQAAQALATSESQPRTLLGFIASLANGVWEPGAHIVSWSGTGSGESLARSGVFFVRIVAESLTGSRHYSSLKKMIRLE